MMQADSIADSTLRYAAGIHVKFYAVHLSDKYLCPAQKFKLGNVIRKGKQEGFVKSERWLLASSLHTISFLSPTAESCNDLLQFQGNSSSPVEAVTKLHCQLADFHLRSFVQKRFSTLKCLPFNCQLKQQLCVRNLQHHKYLQDFCFSLCS